MANFDEKGVMTTQRMRSLELGIQQLDLVLNNFVNLLLKECMDGNDDPATRVKTGKLQGELGSLKRELCEIDLRETDHYDETRQRINELNGSIMELKTELPDYAHRHQWNLLPDVTILRYMASEEIHPGI